MLVAIALPTHVCEPGTILTEGINVPLGWSPPSGDVEAMNTSAVYKVYRTVPAQPPAVRSITPKTMWQVTHFATHDEWQLTGLGASLSPICA